MHAPVAGLRAILVSSRSPRLYYGWIVVGATAVILFVTAGTRTAPGAFHSLAAALGLVVGLAGPISGVFMGRYGVRRVILAALVITAASMALSSQVTEAWQLAFFFGLTPGLGTGLVASVLAATVRTRWFVEHGASCWASSGPARAPAAHGDAVGGGAA